MFSLKGKTAVITGASRGLGKAIAAGFARQGADLILIGRNDSQLAAVTNELGSHDVLISHMTTDVSEETDVAALAEELTLRQTEIDILVNNAGISPYYTKIGNLTVEQWHEVIGVNLTGVFLCCKNLAPLMPRGSSIINVSSVAGQVGLKKQSAYSASKGGVELLTKSLAQECAELGIRVNAIGFGFMETDLTQGIRDHEHLSQRILDRTPLARFGTMDDVAGPAVFLASDASSYVTGHTLMVDGGYTAS